MVITGDGLLLLDPHYIDYMAFQAICESYRRPRVSSSSALLLARSCASCSVNLCELLGVGKGSRTLLEPASWQYDVAKHVQIWMVSFWA